MLLRILQVGLVAGSLLVAGHVSAQVLDTTTAPPASTSYSSFGTIQEEEIDQEALARQLDEFQQRLEALEGGQVDSSVVERIDELESGLESTLEDVEGIGGKFKDYIRAGHGESNIKWFGRIHADWWAFPDADAEVAVLEDGDPQNRLLFRRLRIGAGGDINTNMFFKFESEFAGSSRVSFRDAYLGFDHLPLFNTVIIGNHKRPYGLDHLNSSRYNVFLERPFIIEAINQDARRIGISSNGYTEDLGWNWRYGVFNQELIQANGGDYVGDNLQPELAGRIARTFWWDECSNGRGYGHFALSGSYGLFQPFPAANADPSQAQYLTRPEARSSQRWLNTDIIAGANDFYLGGLEYVLNVGPTQIVAEYQGVMVDRIEAFGPTNRFHGGYVYVSHFLTGEHMPWNRQTGTLGRIKPFENFFSVCDCDGFLQRGRGAWQVAARYSYADFTSRGIDGGRGESLTLGLNWYWNPYSRLQFNYIFGQIRGGASNPNTGGIPVNNADYQIVGLRFMVDF